MAKQSLDKFTTGVRGEQVEATLKANVDKDNANFTELYNAVLTSGDAGKIYATPAAASGVPSLIRILAAHLTSDTPVDGEFLRYTAANGLVWATPAGTEGAGEGTVTSVDVSGGTTGMSFTGNPITSAGTATLTGVLNVANGGTGGTSALTARQNLGAHDAANLSTGVVAKERLSSDTAASGQVLTYDGASVVWSDPSEASFTGKSPNTFLAGPGTGTATATATFRPVVAADLGTGTPDGSKYLRDDLTWQAVSSGLGSAAPNTVAAGPGTGTASATATFRPLTTADLPTGTTAATVALGNHAHSGYAASSHNHDASYSAAGHNHDASYAAASHAHSGTAITSGTVDIARLPTGTTATTVALGNHTHEGGGDGTSLSLGDANTPTAGTLTIYDSAGDPTTVTANAGDLVVGGTSVAYSNHVHANMLVTDATGQEIAASMASTPLVKITPNAFGTAANTTAALHVGSDSGNNNQRGVHAESKTGNAVYARTTGSGADSIYVSNTGQGGGTGVYVNAPGATGFKSESNDGTAYYAVLWGGSGPCFRAYSYSSGAPLLINTLHSTANIAEFQKDSGVVASIANDGAIRRRAERSTGTKALTDASATGMFEVAVATGEATGGTLYYSVAASSGTDRQARSGHVDFSAVNVGGTVTATLSTPSDCVAAPSGTLTVAFTATAGTGKVTINANADSSLDTPTITATFSIVVNGENAITYL